MGNKINPNMKNNKKSQFMIFSITFFILLFMFIYSQETENDYISKSSKTSILSNIVYETCQVGKMSNGSYIDSRFGNFSQSISNYCTSFSYTCNLTILKSAGAPSNLSLLNYTFYNFSLNYKNNGFNYTSNFTC